MNDLSLYSLHASADFTEALKELSSWLYHHNSQLFSHEFADSKQKQLLLDLQSLSEKVKQFPYMGGAGSIPTVRQMSIYEGRFMVVWIVDDIKKVITLVQFKDLLYPRDSHMKNFDIEDD